MALFTRRKKYDIIYSIGANCAAATYMNQHFLRVIAGPFDWCGKVSNKKNFEWRTRLICSHFEGFLQKENLEFVDIEDGIPRDPRFDRYHDNGGPGFILPHDFPIGEPLEKNYDAVKAKYDRRIARFYENIQKAERVLLVWITFGEKGCDHDSIRRHCEAVCKEFGKTVDFLLIWHDGSMGLNQPAVKQDLAPNIALWRANIRRNPTGGHLDYLGARHLIDPIFRVYALKGMEWPAFRARARRVFGKVLSAFIPVRKWRKAVRKPFMENEFNNDYNRRG